MLQHYKIFLAMLIALLSGIWIGDSLTISKHNNHPHQQLTPASSAADSHHAIAQLQQQVKILQSEKHLLTQQLQEHTANVSAQPPIIQQTINANNNTQQLQHQLNELEIEKQERKSKDFGNWIMNSQRHNSRFDFNNELTRRFEQESRDAVWAEEEESRYQQLFSTQDALRDFALRDARCRSTQCEVTVSISNSEQSDRLLQTMSSALQGSEILLATDEQSGTSKLYISSKKGFEFN